MPTSYSCHSCYFPQDLLASTQFSLLFPASWQKHICILQTDIINTRSQTPFILNIKNDTYPIITYFLLHYECLFVHTILTFSLWVLLWTLTFYRLRLFHFSKFWSSDCQRDRWGLLVHWPFSPLNINILPLTFLNVSLFSSRMFLFWFSFSKT